MAESLGKPSAGWRLRLYTVIFEADTRAGRLLDQWLIAVRKDQPGRAPDPP